MTHASILVEEVPWFVEFSDFFFQKNGGWLSTFPPPLHFLWSSRWSLRRRFPAREASGLDPTSQCRCGRCHLPIDTVDGSEIRQTHQLICKKYPLIYRASYLSGGSYGFLPFNNSDSDSGGVSCGNIGRNRMTCYCWWFRNPAFTYQLRPGGFHLPLFTNIYHWVFTHPKGGCWVNSEGLDAVISKDRLADFPQVQPTGGKFSPAGWEICWFYPTRERVHIPSWENEHHLQNWVFRGYVSSQESINILPRHTVMTLKGYLHNQ